MIGLRKVQPYYFDYFASTKQHWVDQPLLKVMNTEFRDRNDQYFRMAIEKGFIKINGKQVTKDTLFKKGDTMSHSVHRHEPPAAAEPIKIIHQDDDLLVIQKPGGLQAHPSGRHRHNTVTHILRKQLDLPALFPINRLDRLTSGLMMIGLNAQKTQAMQKEMITRSVEKEYLCRVEGEFPSEPIQCDAPLKTIAFKFSFQYVDMTGKPSQTLFERVSYNGRTSLVKCYPVTGRTHQLRVHLRYLGYPIANDPLYGRHTPWSHLLDAVDPTCLASFTPVIDKMLEKTSFDSLDVTDGQPRCDDCGGLLVPDPLPGQYLGIWLHAKRYSGKQWSYSTTHSHLTWTQYDFQDDHNIIPAYM
ncbi:pseudouridine synthase [Chlamydoabsidia padenii]|nr:pseudouridine synthase [Chlamydoabsidia padenii]